MGKVVDFLTGQRILETVESPINGKLIVAKDLAWGTHVKSGGRVGLTQSGGVARLVWKKSLEYTKSIKSRVDKVLVLGLGAGGIVEILHEHWPQSKIVGVDIDPLIVELGRKYFDLDKHEVSVKIGDALSVSESLIQQGERYDLVCIDLYVVDEYPKEFETSGFLDVVGKLLAPGGVAVFNRLYYSEKRDLAVVFRKRLEKEFDQVDVIYPEANVMFVCS